MGLSYPVPSSTPAQTVMVKPDFSKYSLAVYEQHQLIYSSRDTGLRPLFDCLQTLRGKSGLILHDKVIGLAAARLTVYSGIISEIITTVTSMPAKKFLEENGMMIEAYDVAANIMTRDGSSVCPGEIIALSTDDADNFFEKTKVMLHGLKQ